MRRLSDRLNMRITRPFSNAGADMSAMRHAQRRSACLTHLPEVRAAEFSRNNKALLEGRAGPEF